MSPRETASERLVAGAMSGTSADGVDVAIVSIAGRGLEMSAKLFHHGHQPYGEDLRRMIFAARQEGSIRLGDLAKMGREISLAYAKAVNESLAAARLTSADLACVAAHGQTIFHDPPNTIQCFDPALVAAEVGCPVVSDFRRADCAAGGQGAPLVPFADYILFRHPTRNRVLLNIGGIANITWLPAGTSIDQIVAFDTGPGNCISDWLMRRHDPSGPGFDEAGGRARRGRFIAHVLGAFVKHEYFSRPPPKSTDAPAMIAAFTEAAGNDLSTASLEDLLATAAVVTAVTIRFGIARFDLEHKLPKQLIVSGGGASNKTVMELLRVEQPNDQILKSDELAVPSAAKEAMAFALLGAATLDEVPSNVCSVTGAKRAVVLGSITPGPF
jgi:anhydro-N-acetylmuramic acid kinase